MRRHFSPALRTFLALLLFGAVSFAAEPGAAFEWQAPDHPAMFRLWIPDGLPRVRAVISLVPGSFGDGRPMADDPDFQALGRRTGAALLGCCLRGEEYEKPWRWSGAVVLKALGELSRQSQHPEIAQAPLLMWGYSAGGMFNYNFVCWKPERVAAFIANKGAYYDGVARGAVIEVPGLWFAGQKDDDYRLQGITDFFTMGRRLGAPWALAIEPNSGHGVGRTKEMGIYFLETMAALRLDPANDDAPSRQAKLPSVPPRAWIGELAHHEIHPFSEKTDANRINSWLPDELTAKRWQAFVNGTPFPTPPPAVGAKAP